jgi:hypothetical protein
MESNERDDLQDQSTHKRGTPTSDYGCCCLQMRKPQNDDAWNEQGYALKNVADIFNSYKMYFIKCSNKFI